MSHQVDECYTVYSETVTKRARVPHTCDACAETIPIGASYTHVFIVFQGRAEHLKRCSRCQKIHEHLRGLCAREGDMWPAERLNCGEEYAEHWGREPPPEIAALAFALPGDPELARG